MIVHGGLVHLHYEHEQCLLSTTLVYHIACRTWSVHPAVAPGPSAAASVTLASHTVAWYASTLFVVGGFDGTVQRSVAALQPAERAWCQGRAGDTCTVTDGCGYCERSSVTGGKATHAFFRLSTGGVLPHCQPSLLHQPLRPDIACFSSRPCSLGLSVGFERKNDTCAEMFDGYDGTVHTKLAAFALMNDTAAARLTLDECAARCVDHNCATFNYRPSSQTCDLFHAPAACLPLLGAVLVATRPGDDCVFFEAPSRRGDACLASYGLDQACSPPCHSEAVCTRLGSEGQSGRDQLACRCSPGHTGNGTHCEAELGCSSFPYNPSRRQCTSADQCAADGLAVFPWDSACHPAAPPDAHPAPKQTCFVSVEDARAHTASGRRLSAAESLLTGLESVVVSALVPDHPPSYALDRDPASCARSAASEDHPTSTLDVSLMQAVAIGLVDVWTQPDAGPNVTELSTTEVALSVSLAGGQGRGCPRVRVPAGGSPSRQTFNCSQLAGAVHLSTVGNATLQVCRLGVYPAQAVPNVTLCGTALDGAWVEGRCAVDCGGYSNCFQCANQPECGWCRETSLCAPRDSCVASIEAAEECHALRPQPGVTQELYYDLYDSWTPEGLMGSARWEARTPDQVLSLSSLRSVDDEPVPVGEVLHGCVTPRATATYYFWIRSLQGIKAHLYLNPLECDDTTAQLVASQPRGFHEDGQRSWTRFKMQKSAPFFLEAGRSYYLRAVTYRYSSRFYGPHDLAVAWTQGSATVGEEDIIGAGFLTEFTATNCSSSSSCAGCLAAANCVWCEASQTCDDKQASSCTSAVHDQGFCAICATITSCDACQHNAGCEWFLAGGSCRPRGTSTDAVANASGGCPKPCSAHDSCASCADHPGCGWCDSARTCYDSGGYRTQFAHGQCLEWATRPGDCRSCEETISCAECISSRDCGWCYDPLDPSKGHCTAGSYEGPTGGHCSPLDSPGGSHGNGSTTSTTAPAPTATSTPRTTTTNAAGATTTTTLATAAATTTLATTEMMWSFERCVDVDECALGYDLCADNATCLNAAGLFPESYNCSCDEGFTGDGKVCRPVCTAGCFHGNCTEPGICTCQEGWSGPSCDRCDPAVDRCASNSTCKPVIGAGYHECACDVGFLALTNRSGCLPVCAPGCVHGRCDRPGTCDCHPGWDGPNCTDCLQGQHDACAEEAVCFNQNGSLGCNCTDGYVGDGTMCEPVCEPGCGPKGRCVRPGVCECDQEFQGNTCSECVNPTLFGCDESALCRLTFAGHGNTSHANVTCSCPESFDGNGTVGNRCRPVCSPACEHGDCIAPGTCACERGSAGPTCADCDESMARCHPDGRCGKSANSALVAAGQPAAPLDNGTRVAYVADGSYYCACKRGYAGDGLACEPLCSRGCVHGTCAFQAEVGGDPGIFGTCTCASGWRGENCTECIPEANPCGELASCVSDGRQFSCRCRPGFGDEPPCAPVCDQGCRHGTCVAPDVCRCSAGAAGPACDACSTPNPCSEWALCSVSGGSGVVSRSCACMDGFVGDGVYCAPACDGCVHGSCVAPADCRCEPGWTGPDCSLCDRSRPSCGTNALCNASSQCSCADGYAGHDGEGCVPACTQGCIHGNCSAPEVCTCAEGWAGPACGQCIGGADHCPANSTCTADSDGTNRCLCDPGFELSGGRCTAICRDGCVMGHCVSPGECSCWPGWENHMLRNCTECIATSPLAPPDSPPQNVCADNASCTDPMSATGVPGPVVCQCDEGYVGDGIPPFEGRPDAAAGCMPSCSTPCGPNGRCTAPNHCTCDPSWGGPGCQGCPEDNACAASAVCRKFSAISEVNTTAVELGIVSVVLGGNYTCQCPGDGWRGNGTECLPVCEEPCVHGACVAPETCKCNPSPLVANTPGWTGKTCDECVQGVHVCHPNATCSSVNGSLACECAPGFRGDGVVCEAICSAGCVQGECSAPDVCTCHLAADGVSPGWYGEDCSLCVQGAHTCHDNASCSSVDGRLACECSPGFAGDGVTDCRPVCNFDCGHGTCTGPNTCTCQLGWTGPRCDIDCGCNGHSTCLGGAGLCDACQHRTAGTNCSVCAADSWGDASDPNGCLACQCNQHGACDPADGGCTCDDVTEGNRCERCKTGLFGTARDGGTCYHSCDNIRHRVLLTDNQGAISSGVQVPCRTDEEEFCHESMQACAFIIRPEVPNQTIVLHFEEFSTECGYDLMHVYDGPSTESPLLAALSGFHVARDIVAVSGVMLVHWFADQNVAFRGFRATYVAAACPANCSRRGACDSAEGRCQCTPGWMGAACDTPTCPGNCSAAHGGGECSSDGSCVCKDGFSGEDCSFRVHDDRGWTGSPFVLPTPTAGHTAVVRQSHGEVWVFGGRLPRSADGFSAELAVMRLGEPGTARRVTNPRSPWPSGRHGHSAVLAEGRMLMYGGLTSAGTSSELWCFHFANETWDLIQPLAVNGLAVPPKLHGHTAIVLSGAMLLLGGRGWLDGFNEHEYWLALSNTTWLRRDRTTGSRPAALFQHSAALSEPTNQLLVYGGLTRHRMANGVSYGDGSTAPALYSYHDVGTTATAWPTIFTCLSSLPARRSALAIPPPCYLELTRAFLAIRVPFYRTRCRTHCLS